MFSLNQSIQYYLSPGATDMRKSFDSLCCQVTTGMHRQPGSGEVFIFINRRRDQVKLLHWEKGGFVIYYKRLESGTFEIPKVTKETTSVQITWPELVMIVEGISLQPIKYRKRFG